MRPPIEWPYRRDRPAVRRGAHRRQPLREVVVVLGSSGRRRRAGRREPPLPRWSYACGSMPAAANCAPDVLVPAGVLAEAVDDEQAAHGSAAGQCRVRSSVPSKP